MGALLGDLTPFEDDDLASTSDRREAVGDDDRGASPEQALKALLDRLLGAHVDVGGRRHQNQDPRLGEQRAGEGDELALTGGELDPALADLGLDALRQCATNSVAPTVADRSFDFLQAGLGAAEGDVLANTAGEEKALRGRCRAGAEARPAEHPPQVVAVNQYPPLLGVIEAGDELGEGRLAGSGRADQGQGLTGGDVEVDIM